eukprot:8242508-Pyramimonas_sp.AAC.1
MDLLAIKDSIHQHSVCDKNQRKVMNFLMAEANSRKGAATEEDVPLASVPALKCFHGDGETSRQVPKVRSARSLS